MFYLQQSYANFFYLEKIKLLGVVWLLLAFTKDRTSESRLLRLFFVLVKLNNVSNRYDITNEFSLQLQSRISMFHFHVIVFVLWSVIVFVNYFLHHNHQRL